MPEEHLAVLPDRLRDAAEGMPGSESLSKSVRTGAWYREGKARLLFPECPMEQSDHTGMGVNGAEMPGGNSSGILKPDNLHSPGQRRMRRYICRGMSARLSEAALRRRESGFYPQHAEAPVPFTGVRRSARSCLPLSGCGHTPDALRKNAASAKRNGEAHGCPGRKRHRNAPTGKHRPIYMF